MNKLCIKKLSSFCLTVLLTYSCSKENVDLDSTNQKEPFQLYQEAYAGFLRGDYFYASKKIFKGRIKF